MADHESEEALSPEDILLQKHKKQSKELQAQIQRLKHGVPKGDKKKKKEMTAQIACLEAELSAKQEQELNALENSNAVNDITGDLGLLTTEDGLCAGGMDKPKKLTKAQKRRDKKDQKDKQRLEEIEQQEVVNLTGARHIEAQKLSACLKPKGLGLMEIPSDGNCLYAALVDQLQRHNVQSSVDDLRSAAAAHLRSQPDDYMPFLCKTDSGDPYTEAEYDAYCTKLETTCEWGGQLEIQALARVLQRTIHVVQAEAPTIIQGEEYQTEPLTLSYHHHYYGLGEHFNSVRPQSELPNDDEEDDDKFS